MNDAEREIAAFLREEADSMEPTAAMYPRVLSRAKFRRVLTATLAGLAVLAVGVSGVVMATAIRPQAAIEPAVPEEVPGVEVTPIKDVFAQEVAVTDDSVWVNGGGQIYEVDPGSNEVIKTVREVVALGPFAVGEGAVWQTSWGGDIGPGGVPPRGKVVRIGLEELGRHEGNVAFQEVGQVIWRSGRNEAPEAVVTGFGSLWVAEKVGDRILRFSPEGSLLTEIPVGHTPVDVAAGFGGVWVVHTRSDPNHYGKGDATLLKIDPASASPSKPVPAGNCPHSVTTGASAVWVLDYCDEVVRKFDPETMQSLGVAYLPSVATALAVGDGFLWTVHPEEGVVLRTDLEGLHQVGDPTRLRQGSDYGPSAITYGAGSIWVSDVKLFRLNVE
jgi:streptogramin lyase